MGKEIRANQPMRLEGSKNTRELGGYSTVNGINTINGAFLRSDKPSSFTERDQEILYRYGVRLVLDLRSQGEIDHEPCVLKGYQDIEYVHVPLIDNIQSDPTKLNLPASLGETYITLVDGSKKSFYTAFCAMLRHRDDCVFFNCTGGKDRTGVMSMLLLKLAGVPDEIVIADYAATYFNLKEEMDQYLAAMKEMNMQVPVYLMMSEPENMKTALAHLHSTYGTVEAYLEEIGLKHQEIQGLKQKLLGQAK